MTTSELTERPWSDLAVPPGEFLEEEMAELGMTQQDLARRTGRPVQVINEIIRGKKAITQDTAIDLESVLGIPAHMWVNLEAEFQLTKARQREELELERQIEWLKEFPVKEMEKLGWITAPESQSEQVRVLLRFFGVNSFAAYQKVSPTSELRITPDARFSEGALNAWLRKGEIDGRDIDTGLYEQTAFLGAVEEIRRFAHQPASVAIGDVVKLCAAAGVAVVITQPLPMSGATGCVRWLTPRNALIQLSDRSMSDNRFWFDFFHECGHVLKHRVRQVFVEGIECESPEEDRANRFANDQLAAS